MSRLTQDSRLIAISDFSLGKDTFLLTEFAGTEHISDLFSFNIEALSADLSIGPEKVIGKTASILIRSQHHRKFHGYVSDFAFGEIEADNLRRYQMTLVPWLWFLTKTNNHRIFQNKTAKDIISEIFVAHGFTDFDFRAESGSEREYCIQHNESDFDFVSRLLEEQGIAYYFQHSDDKHTLILVDEKYAYETVAETDLEYSKGNTPKVQINQWEHNYHLKKDRWSLSDYDFKKPTKDLLSTLQSGSSFNQNGNLEHYRYPGYYDNSLREHLVRVCIEAEETPLNSVCGKSDCSSFFAGGRFTLAKHTNQSEKGDYTLTRVTHKASDRSYYSGKEADNSYGNDFNCAPAEVHFRPAQKHRRPVMKGLQSAMVVGPAGEEIYIDEFGRIKVQFIWDREGQSDEGSSCWLRVMQVWAGNKWGASFIPRIGQEVIVAFLDGDPDRPIVTGTVYNQQNMPPYTSKTQSGIKSHSTTGGTASNFNEIRFDDKIGAEELFMQAEKDYNLNIKNNSGVTVGANATRSVGGDDSLNVAGNRTAGVSGSESLSVGADQSLDVGASRSVSVGASQSTNVGANQSLNVAANLSETIGANASKNIAGSSNLSVASKQSVNVGGIATESIGGVKALTVGAAYQVSVGAAKNETVGLSSSEQVGIMKHITAGSSITLSCGDASIKLESGGKISIKGTELVVDGGDKCMITSSQTSVN